VTSAYGWRSDPFTGESRFHRGVDLRATYGTEVPAASGGTVVSAGERGTYGNLVVIRDEQGVETRYAHLSATLVKEGDVIEPGTPIGRVGSSGRSTAPHLHFEVLVNGERVDPARWASRVGRGPLKSDGGAVD
jgi:murein DD-endopeptidase MepM/ murein hydrolase activator NlpD